MLYETKISSIVLRHGLGITAVDFDKTAKVSPSVIITEKDGKTVIVQKKEDGKLSSVTVNGTGIGKKRGEVSDFLRKSGVNILCDATSDSTYSIVTDRDSASLARELLTLEFFR